MASKWSRRGWLGEHLGNATFADLMALAFEVRELFHPLSPQPVFVELVNEVGKCVIANASEIVRIEASWSDEGDGVEIVFLTDGSHYSVPNGPKGEALVLAQLDRAGIRTFGLDEGNDGHTGPDDRVPVDEVIR